jgi:hypothetical protein
MSSGRLSVKSQNSAGGGMRGRPTSSGSLLIETVNDRVKDQTLAVLYGIF